MELEEYLNRMTMVYWQSFPEIPIFGALLKEFATLLVFNCYEIYVFVIQLISFLSGKSSSTIWQLLLIWNPGVGEKERY